MFGVKPSKEARLNMGKAQRGNKNALGYKHTEEAKKRMSELAKGRIPWCKGKKMSPEHKKKLSDVHKKLVKEEKNIPPSRKGSKMPESAKRLISKRMIGRKLSKATKQKLSKQKIGNKNPNWNNGSSFEPYTIDWTETLRQSIRERDRYICQLCSKPQGDRALCVHHIDYDKKNCNPSNLIALCVGCNVGVNTNRNYWIDYFVKKVLKQ